MGIFNLFGNKFRCPNCGNVANHAKMVKSEQDKAVDKMMASILSADSLMGKAAREYAEDGEMKCEQCGEMFTKSSAEIWRKIAKENGEKFAIAEYKSS